VPVSGSALALLAGLLALSGCAALPPIRSVPAAEHPSLQARCRACFSAGSFRQLHSIQARLPLGNRAAMVGVTVADVPGRRLRLVAMAVEGMTLLDALAEPGRLRLLRAMPPFDRRSFVAGLFRDVSLLLLPPEGAPARVGRSPGGHPVCRYRQADGGTLDVTIPSPGRCDLALADRRNRRHRQATLVRTEGDPWARTLRLTARGALGYTLHLERLEADAISDPAPLLQP
jgi:hypothetical protein